MATPTFCTFFLRFAPRSLSPPLFTDLPPGVFPLKKHGRASESYLFAGARLVTARSLRASLAPPLAVQRCVTSVTRGTVCDFFLEPSVPPGSILRNEYKSAFCFWSTVASFVRLRERVRTSPDDSAECFPESSFFPLRDTLISLGDWNLKRACPATISASKMASARGRSFSNRSSQSQDDVDPSGIWPAARNR